MKTLVKTPMDLGDFLRKHIALIKHKRLFYIIEPRLEQGKTIKFGIAGIDSGNPFNRLKEYMLTYGETDPENPCRGVIVHYIGVTEYERHVRYKNSEVFRIEKYLKEIYKSTSESKHDSRGAERVSKKHLPNILRDLRALRMPDISTELRSTNRESTKRYQDDHKAYIDTVTPRRTRAQTRLLEGT